MVVGGQVGLELREKFLGVSDAPAGQDLKTQ